uniref:Uncharacterized protein n=1 Tax=Anguilla anguilla TaxID=7936 RepID=A0A0E9TS64_ANGAN
MLCLFKGKLVLHYAKILKMFTFRLHTHRSKNT